MKETDGPEYWDRRAQQLEAELELSPGDLYEDSAYHPCLCVEVNYSDDDIWGISLVDGSHPRACSLEHSGVRKINVHEAWLLKQKIEQKIRDES